MSTVRITCRVENPADPKRGASVPDLPVDERKNFTWLPRQTLESIGLEPVKKRLQIEIAKGHIVTRDVGFAVLRVDERQTVDDVVFAKKGDRALLGSRALHGLNVQPDPHRKRLVGRGPIPAASGQAPDLAI